MMKILGILAVIALGGFFLFSNIREVTITSSPSASESSAEKPGVPTSTNAMASSATSSLGSSSGTKVAVPVNGDIEKQLPLFDPPVVVKGVYVTNWSAGSARTMDRIIKLIDSTELNAIVIDIKDYSGMVAYRTGVADVQKAGAEREIRIEKPNALIKTLHDRGIYVIGRIAVFQDQVLAAAHPEWALKNKSTGEIWRDHKGLAWLDPSIPEVWDYHVALARDVLSRGFDEVNFDYIRFASDGDLSAIGYPSWKGGASKESVISSFFKYLRENLAGAKISADLFGLATIQNDDLGIGQKIESAYRYFDYVSPMVYPSHYASGFLGYKNPAAYPAEVIAYSMENAVRKFAVLNGTGAASSTSSASGTPAVPLHAYSARLRPWLQDFDMGATYDAAMVRKEIQAVDGVLLANPELYAGWLLWDPSNAYTPGALAPASST